MGFFAPATMAIAHRLPHYLPTEEDRWHLSVRVSPELTAWCVHDHKDGSVVALYADKKPDTWPTADALPVRPVTSSFVVLPTWSTLVPEALYRPGTESQQLQLLYGELPPGILRTEPLAKPEARCIHQHERALEERVVRRFTHARALPQQAVLVHAALARPDAERYTVVAERTTDRLDVAIARGTELLLSNTYPAVRGEDLLYFLMLALEGCGCTPSACLLYLSGIAVTEAEQRSVARYFPALRSWREGSLAEAAAPWGSLVEQFALVR